MKVVGASLARARFGALLAQVQQGESFTIARRGRAVARLVPAAGAPQRPWAEIVRELAEIRRTHPAPRGAIRSAIHAARRYEGRGR
jgi:prevent-host-death family protein